MTASHQRLAHATRTSDSYIHTDGRTNREVGDLRKSLALRNAQGANADFDSDLDVNHLATTLGDVAAMLTTARERLTNIRRGEQRQPLNQWTRSVVLRRDGYRCVWCGAGGPGSGEHLEVDHIVPWSAGGSDATDNLRALCAWCNQERSNYRTDSDHATALLIVTSCVRDQMPWRAEWDHEVREIAADDQEVAVWCVLCRRRSTTSRRAADSERQRQANLPPREDT